MVTDPPLGNKSAFFLKIQNHFGSFIGQSIAQSAESYLRRWGVDPNALTKVTTGNNAIVFSFNDTLAIKVNTELETHQQTPLGANPLVVEKLHSATLGYDQGGVAISLEVVPFLNTHDTKPYHVKALCRELYTKYNLLFRDNKCENVGLTKDGTPYILDAGSVIPITSLGRLDLDKPFIYPELSGFNTSTKQWDTEASTHAFIWPPSQKEVPEFKLAALLLQSPAPEGRPGV